MSVNGEIGVTKEKQAEKQGPVVEEIDPWRQWRLEPERSSMAMAPRNVLWVINSHQTGVSDAANASLAERLPGGQRIRAYMRPHSRRRALLSHLLQRHACCELAKLHPDQVQIKRTLGGKPFAAVDPAAHCPNFNFNASHDGEYVVLAASTHFLTGVDVHKRQAADCSCEHLEARLTAAQWAQAEAMSPDQRKIWAQAVFAIKEAYTKAVGVGLGEALDSIEFVPPLPSAWAEPAVPGKKLPWKGRVQHLTQGEFCNQGDQGEWCLELRWIDADHIVATATGDVARAVDADGDFTSRLTRPGLCPSSVEEGSFGVPEQLGIFDLLSPEELAACEELTSCETRDSD